MGEFVGRVVHCSEADDVLHAGRSVHALRILLGYAGILYATTDTTYTGSSIYKQAAQLKGLLPYFHPHLTFFYIILLRCCFASICKNLHLPSTLD